MKVLQGLICDMEREQKNLIVGVLGEFEGLVFRKMKRRNYIEKLTRDPEVKLLETTGSGTVKVL